MPSHGARDLRVRLLTRAPRSVGARGESRGWDTQAPRGRLAAPRGVHRRAGRGARAASGSWRNTRDYETVNTDHLRSQEDRELADLLRVAAYTGLRRGDLVVLRWDDVRWDERVLVVRRALSGNVEQSTKSRRIRYVPLGDQALGALDRLFRRPNFTGPDDYVFATVLGGRPDPSALRRRYVGCREAAGLPPLRFHDLRHTAGTLLTRVLDPVSVKEILGHADLKTTERYLHAQRASRLAHAATRAFTAGAPVAAQSSETTLRALVDRLGAEEVLRVLETVA